MLTFRDRQRSSPRIVYDNRSGWRRYMVIIAAIMLLNWDGSAVARNVAIAIADTSPYHVHSPGKPFSFRVRVNYGGSGNVRYYWQDYLGHRLSKPVIINSGTSTVRSAARPVGYYGLVFAATGGLKLPHRRAGEAREYGFAVLPSRTVAGRKLNPTSPFGMVHADFNDPYLDGWTKTSTWLSARSAQNQYMVRAAKWRARIDRRREAGLKELPLILRDPWDWKDSRPVSAHRLALIKSLAKQYFQADRNVRYWEVGREENLSKRYKQRYYWPNLAAKIAAVRRAADEANPGIKLIYQIAGLKLEKIHNFLGSKAARIYDILSLHPYAWPDFPTPETWMAKYLDTARAYMRKNGIVKMPIWFTEVGAPQQGNCPGCFFGYPKKGPVRGLSPVGEAVYMVKLHVLALENGVKKIFWYNYRDRGARREYAEVHFGIRDFWGFPKPVYAAYFNLHNRIKDKSPAGLRRLSGDVWVAAFKGTDQDVLVAWTYPRSDAQVSWSSLRKGLSRDQVVEVANPVGTPVSIASKGAHLSRQPLFISVSHAK